MTSFVIKITEDNIIASTQQSIQEGTILMNLPWTNVDVSYAKAITFLLTVTTRQERAGSE